MIDVRLMSAAVAILLVLTGVAVFRRQAKATSCSRHSRLAGKIAVVVGWVSLVAGIVLMGYTLVLYWG